MNRRTRTEVLVEGDGRVVCELAELVEAEASVEAQRAEVASLEREETELRESTQKARTTFYGIIAVAALVVVVIILLVSCAA